MNITNGMKRLLKNFSIILLALTLLVSVLCGSVFAAGTDDVNIPDIYKQIALNFFEQQYDELNLEYGNFDVELEADLFDSEENVVAKAIVVNRDDKYDYVVLNLTTSQIDEFGFDEPTALEKYSNKTYYTGLLNYFTFEKNKFESSATHELFSVSAFKKLSKTITEKYNNFINKASKIFRCNNIPLPDARKTGFNGFYDYAYVDGYNTGNGYEFYDCKFHPGILSGCADYDIRFKSQSVFNNYFGTRNSCGPTAFTNLCIYLNWREISNRDGEVNVLRLNSEFETFKRFRELTNHDNDKGTANSTYAGAFQKYAEEQNYNCRVVPNLTKFEQFKEYLDNYNAIITSIGLYSSEDSDSFGHAVLTLGYLQYRYEYQVQHQVLWHKWTTTEYKYSNYLRVIDGWGTSNEGMYISFSNYWDRLSGFVTMLLSY